ncbi:MAG: hypothetical protein KJ936_07440 [Proteobacteria bacterium]|nr:hypothetical protein [Pseudomonadota bacterium]
MTKATSMRLLKITFNRDLLLPGSMHSLIGENRASCRKGRCNFLRSALMALQAQEYMDMAQA